MATSEAKEIKKQETLVRFNIISYKTRLRLIVSKMGIFFLGGVSHSKTEHSKTEGSR